MANETSGLHGSDAEVYSDELLALKEENLMLKEQILELMESKSNAGGNAPGNEFHDAAETRFANIKISTDSYIASNQALVNSAQYLLTSIDYNALLLFSENLINGYRNELDMALTGEEQKLLELKIEMERTFIHSLAMYNSFTQKVNEILARYNTYAAAIIQVEAQSKSRIVSADMAEVNHFVKM